MSSLNRKPSVELKHSQQIIKLLATQDILCLMDENMFRFSSHFLEFLQKRTRISWKSYLNDGPSIKPMLACNHFSDTINSWLAQFLYKILKIIYFYKLWLKDYCVRAINQWFNNNINKCLVWENNNLCIIEKLIN